MTDIDAVVEAAGPPQGMVTLTHVMYGLHAFSAITGLMSAALVVTAFLTGWPSIIAVIMNYVKRSEAAGTFLDSHFSWQLRTFWFALLWVVIGWLLIVTIIGAVIGVPLLLGVGVWVLYRIARGWINLANRKPMPV
ncbi:MAG TPA: hypothetical protein VNM70_11200 [Burkholderiales bacterium]|jgi:uncharacterized membrane protein|nr:hypothetical protein [Burkholderiales bacterium]